MYMWCLEWHKKWTTSWNEVTKFDFSLFFFMMCQFAMLSIYWAILPFPLFIVSNLSFDMLCIFFCLHGIITEIISYFILSTLIALFYDTISLTHSTLNLLSLSLSFSCESRYMLNITSMMMILLNQKQKHHMKEKKVYNFDMKQGCMYVVVCVRW